MKAEERNPPEAVTPGAVSAIRAFSRLLRIRAHNSLGYERSEVKIILLRRKRRQVPWQNLELTWQNLELTGENHCCNNRERPGLVADRPNVYEYHHASLDDAFARSGRDRRFFAGGLALAAAQSLGYFAPTGENSLTLRHYLALAEDREIYASLWMTLKLATAVTVISAAAGLALALGLREMARRSHAINLLLQIPLSVPHLAMAGALITVIAPSGLLARVAYALGFIQQPADFPALINDRYGFGIAISYILKETPFILGRPFPAMLSVLAQQRLKLAEALSIVAIIGLALIPLAMLTARSFAQSWYWPRLAPPAWSLRGWRYVFSPTAEVLPSLATSLIVALAVTLFALIVALPASRALAWEEFRAKHAVIFALLLPVLTPPH